MLTVVTLTSPSGTLTVVCDALARDNLVPQNVVLAGCREVVAEGLTSVRVWSVPAAWVTSYVMGHAADPALVPPPAAPESDGVAHG
jgi:hypothetical protein